MPNPIAGLVASHLAPLQWSHPDVLARETFRQLGVLLPRIGANLNGLIRADNAAADSVPYRSALRLYRSLDPSAPSPTTMQRVVDELLRISNQGLSQGPLRAPGTSGTHREALRLLWADLEGLKRLEHRRP